MSSYDQYKKEKQDMIDSRKLKLSTPDGGAGLLTPEEHEDLTPKTFKQKWDNYWYHYKTRTIGITIGGILLLTFVFQMVFKTKYDMSLAFVSQYPLSVFADRAKSTLAKPELLDDTTGNGKLDLETTFIQLDFEGKFETNPQMNQAAVVQLTGRMSAMDSFLYITDDIGYNYMLGMDALFMDLTPYVEKANPDSKATLSQDGKKYYIKGTELAKQMDMGDVGDELFVCFFDYSSLDESRQQKKNIKAGYERDLAYLERLLAFE